MSTIGVIIARFQTPYLKDSHKALLHLVKKKHSKVLLVLGVSPVKGCRKNPLDFYSRKNLINQDYPDVDVLPLPDHPLDRDWSQNLDLLLTNFSASAEFKLYGSGTNFISHYSGRFEVVELPKSSTHDDTLSREQISDHVLNSEGFRVGMVYAFSNAYVKVYPTVDIAVFRNGKSELLLGKKTIDNKWRLLGGFADPTDDSYEEAAKRELTEECGEIETTPMVYEKSFRVDDWRYRSEEDKIITCLFSTDCLSGEPKGSDDIAEVRWFPLTAVEILLKQQQTAEEHTPQFKLLLNKYADT